MNCTIKFIVFYNIHKVVNIKDIIHRIYSSSEEEEVDSDSDSEEEDDSEEPQDSTRSYRKAAPELLYGPRGPLVTATPSKAEPIRFGSSTTTSAFPFAQAAYNTFKSAEATN